MQCGRIQLQERAKTVVKNRPQTSDKPRRFCQKRLVDPQHEEDPRWIDVFDRFHCNEPETDYKKDKYETAKLVESDLYLSVQTLKFQGNEQERKRPRTSFKYKSISQHNAHRMFVKQVVPSIEVDEDCSSQLTSYFYDDYEKYLSNDTRPSSGKSSIFFQGLATKFQKHKATQVDFAKTVTKKLHKVELKKLMTNETASEEKENDELTESHETDTKISFHKTGKRKSITISRVPSPETVQVIRVDVVCNNSSSSPHSEYDDEKSRMPTRAAIEKKKYYDPINLRNSHFAHKYLLTNTIKSLDENVSGGAKVTLLCKTFRLADRSKKVPNTTSSCS